MQLRAWVTRRERLLPHKHYISLSTAAVPSGVSSWPRPDGPDGRRGVSYVHFDAGPSPSFPRALDGETARFGRGHITDRDPGKGRGVQ